MEISIWNLAYFKVYLNFNKIINWKLQILNCSGLIYFYTKICRNLITRQSKIKAIYFMPPAVCWQGFVSARKPICSARWHARPFPSAQEYHICAAPHLHTLSCKWFPRTLTQGSSRNSLETGNNTSKFYKILFALVRDGPASAGG